MRSYVLFSVVCLQLGWTYGEPAGVGVYAYQDSAGNRYGGKFDLDDAQVFAKGKNPNGANSNPGWGPFAPPFMPNFTPFSFDEFFPEYFSNLENLLHEAFNQNLENQRLAFNAAKKAYDLTSNQAGYIPHSPGRFDNFGGFGDFSSYMPRGGQAAYAGAAAGPGFTHQVAAISPENPNQENVNIMSRFAETPNTDGGKYYSVSSSSFASSSNVNGERQGSRSAETVVNNNGQITRYKVHS